MDELDWLYVIAALLSTAVVAFVEWRRHSKDSEHGERIAALEQAHNNLASVINDMDSPDLRPLEARIYDIEKTLAILNHTVKSWEE